MKRPVMRSIWAEIIPQKFDYCETDITKVSYKDTGSDFEIYWSVFPYQKNDVRAEKISRKMVAHNAYVFDPPPFERFVVGQSLKRVYVYSDIVRLDIITTGSLLRVECDSYHIEDLK